MRDRELERDRSAERDAGDVEAPRRRPRRRRASTPSARSAIVNGSRAAGLAPWPGQVDAQDPQAGGQRRHAARATTPSQSAVVVPSEGSSTRRSVAAAGRGPRRRTIRAGGERSSVRPFVERRGIGRRRASTTAPDARRGRRSRGRRTSPGLSREDALDGVAVDRESGDQVGRGIRALERPGAASARSGVPLGVPLARGPVVLRRPPPRCSVATRPGASQPAAVSSDGVDGVALVRHGRRAAAAARGASSPISVRARNVDVAPDAAEHRDDRGGRVADGEHRRALGVPRATGVVEPELRGSRRPQSSASRRAARSSIGCRPVPTAPPSCTGKASRVDDLDRAT